MPTDRIVALRGGWGLFRKGSSGEILLRLTYKAYVEDEEDDRAAGSGSIDASDSDDELLESYESTAKMPKETEESFMDVLAALIVSEEFLGIVASEDGSAKTLSDVPTTAPTSLGPRSLDANSASQDESGRTEVSRGKFFILYPEIKSSL